MRPGARHGAHRWLGQYHTAWPDAADKDECKDERMVGVDAVMQSDNAEMYYDQDTEVQLLTKLLGHLTDKTVIDVGAEHGSFVGALLKAGADAVYAFEPYPPSVEILRSTFGETPAVHVFDLAVGAADGEVTLHVVEDKTGHAADAYHSLVAF